MRVRECISTFAHARECTCECIYVRAFVRKGVRVLGRVHERACAFARARMLARLYLPACMPVRACVRESVPALSPVCARARVRTPMYACMIAIQPGPLEIFKVQTPASQIRTSPLRSQIC